MKLRNGIKFLKRATLSVALFFISGTVSASETYRDIIEKAYNLSLQKDRTQAVSILTGALKRENRKSTAQKELATALEQVAKVFYSDKAQQLYELALSLKSTDTATAVVKLQEASRLEPENTSIEVALARLAISTGDCDGAASRMARQKDLVIAIEELRLLNAQISICQGQFKDYLAIKNSQDPKQLKLILFWKTLESEYFYRTGAFTKALEAAQAAQKIEASFPEPLYWQWKSEIELKQKQSRVPQKYINLCKTLNSRQQRAYLPEPQLCRRTPEIENFLKKNNNS